MMSEYEYDQPSDDGKVLEKDAALRLALSRLASEFSRESMLSLQRFFGSRHAPIISTGSLKLDLALGTGGLPKGRVVEIYGWEASGKTTLALHIIKEAQKRGGYCAYVDVENALDPSLAESIGVNTEDLLISHLESAESSLSVVDTLIKSGAIDVIVVDSVLRPVLQCSLGHGAAWETEMMSEYEYDQPSDDGKVLEKDAALRLALSRLASEFSRESMLSLQRFFGSRHAPIISTGSLKLDLALGTGGLPKGRVVEIYGWEASGKTTLALHIIKEAQKRGGYCAYVDVENALDPSLAESIGVNTEDLLISHLESAESSLSVVDTLIKSGAIDVIVVDSVAALVPQSELDSVIDGTRPKGQSRLMTQALRKIHSSLCQSQTLLIFINQVRSRPCEGFGNANEVTCGGNALKFYAAVRMRTMKTGLLRNEDEITGVSVSVQIVKNKLAPAMKKAELEIIFGKGITSEAEVLEMACTHGVISKMGDGYYIEGEVLKDEEEAEKYLAENHEVLEKVVSILRSQLFERT
ncbi:AAA+ ATPase domain [Macleaya cordata]|uniref:AAA+ ATPase domain n=1 Tax=Macleaya cordata TaxID=56857 RepID=A0A200RB18_MACCD|nr:AAA+ ATPase domain [Macleaya cordata]